MKLNQPIISIAPMMDYTDRHYRFLMRLITQKTLLYTEMMHVNQILRGDSHRYLRFNAEEHPLALQFGGSVPEELARTAQIAETWGYDEINLNVGCPSDRVQAGKFGACLMHEPNLVAECFSAMQAQVNIPVTVKTRIGIDDSDEYEFLQNFVNILKKAACKTFIIHARKAWLQGLSPKENRTIPPLNYQRVYQLKKDFPDLMIHINGGIKTVAEIKAHLQHIDGVMVGREAYSNPYLFMEIEKLLNPEIRIKTRVEIYEEYLQYIEKEFHQGQHLQPMVRHVFGLFHGEPNAKSWRRFITENLQRSPTDITILHQAKQFL
jgi:tRNA-dihydrouridine synthase A